MQIDKTIPLSSTHAWRHQRRPRAAIWHERNKCIFSLDELDSFKIVYKGLNLTLRVKALLLYFHCVTASRTDDVRCNKRLWTRVIAADEMCESCCWTSSVSLKNKTTLASTVSFFPYENCMHGNWMHRILKLEKLLHVMLKSETNF